MKSAPDAETPSFIIDCLEAEGCDVQFEPWEAVHRLNADDIFTVRTWALSKGTVEISYIAGGIVVGLGSDSPDFITNRAGEKLPL